MGQLPNPGIYDKELSGSKVKDEAESCCNSTFCWSNPSQDLLITECLQETHLHGLKFIAQPNRHLLERIFWMVAFLVGMMCAGYLISDVWRKYQTSPVILAFDARDLPISKIPFPAVTICNINKVQKKFAMELEEELKKGENPQASLDMDTMRSICTSKPTFANSIPEGKELFDGEKFGESVNQSVSYVSDFLHRAAQPCSEMLQRCFWSGKEVKCAEIFFPIITELGICCTFNMMPPSILLKFPSTLDVKSSSKSEAEYMEIEKRNWEKAINSSHQKNLYRKIVPPRRQHQPGLSHGLALLLYPDVDNYFCKATDSAGFRVAFHDPKDTPHVTEFGIAVPPETDICVEIKPVLTTAGENIRKFSKRDRACYFQHELELKYYNHYTQLNCFNECEADLHLQKCNCSWYFEPRDIYTRTCVPEETIAACSLSLKRELSEGTLSEEKCSHCLPLCHQLRFNVQSSQSQFLNQTVLWKSKDELEKLSIKQPIWLGKPVTIMHLYYGDANIVPKQRKELYGTTDLFASTGGLLGLCLGFSGLSAVEVIYFCTIRLWLRSSHKNNSSGSTRNKLRRMARRIKGRHKSQRSKREVRLEKNMIPFRPKGISNPKIIKFESELTPTDHSQNLYSGFQIY